MPDREADTRGRRFPLRVVEISDGVAGAACGRLFAALGDEVVTLEPSEGDTLRATEPLDGSGTGYAFQALNAGKQSLIADLRGRRGRADAISLLSVADVVIVDHLGVDSSFPGLGTREIRTRLPHLVVVSITGYGLDDLRSAGAVDSLIAEAAGGSLTMIGEPGRRPLALGGEQAAHAGAVAGHFGAMLKLHGDAGGGLVDVALCDVAAYLDWKSDITRAVTGRTPTRVGGTAGRWRILPAADGWLGVVFQPAQWDAVVRLVGDPRLSRPELRDEEGRRARADEWWPVIAEWAVSRPVRDLYAAAQNLGLPFGFCVDLKEVADHRRDRVPGDAVASASPFTPCDGFGWSTGPAPSLDAHQESLWRNRPRASPRPVPPTERPAPLDGLVVLDLGTITAGAATGRLLADYGATVIKVESPDHPDGFREWAGPPADSNVIRAGESPMFASNNAGKAAIALDLKSEHGRAAFLRLVEQADVVIENFRVGVTTRLGVDPAAVHAVNPRLLYVSLSSQGWTGLEASHASYGSTLDLLSGLASVTGYGDGRPVWSSEDVNYPDQLASLFGAAMTVGCLARGIRGIHLDLSQREIVSWTLTDRLLQWARSGVLAPAEGNRRPGSAPHEVYRCRGDDRWIAVACCSDTQRAALAAAAGLRVDSFTLRWWTEHADDLDTSIEEWTRTRSPEDCAALLLAAGVPNTPVRDAATRAPRITARGVLLEGTLPTKGYPFVLDWYQPTPLLPAPRVGQHNEIVRTARRTSLREAVEIALRR